MVKHYSLLLVIILSISLISCSQLTKKDDVAYVKKNIIESFINKDIEKLKKIFNSELNKKNTIDKQINALFDSIEGKIISYELNCLDGSEQEKVDNFKIIYSDLSPFIRKIITDKSKEYEIHCYYLRIDNENPNKVGVYRIAVYDLNNNILYEIK